MNYLRRRCGVAEGVLLVRPVVIDAECALGQPERRSLGSVAELREEALDLHPIALLDVGHALAHFFDCPSKVQAQDRRVLLDEEAEELNLPVDWVKASSGLLDEDLPGARARDGGRPHCEGALLGDQV